MDLKAFLRPGKIMYFRYAVFNMTPAVLSIFIMIYPGYKIYNTFRYFGFNVSAPFKEHPEGFFIFLFLMIILICVYLITVYIVHLIISIALYGFERITIDELKNLIYLNKYPDSWFKVQGE